ncbi:MAG: hypothetical protein D3924_18225 [Candidatus Electrothrix sp. AR4]|nr:hypothetical protein [Candidatus Electrothrix sp. AR4]
MRDSIKKAIGSTVQDFIDSGVKTSFTQKDLNVLGVKIPVINLAIAQPNEIKENPRISQIVHPLDAVRNV